MKRLLFLVLFGALAAASANAQSFNGSQISDARNGMRPGDIGAHAPPVTNPEPITLVALAGGAAVAGGLLRRRKDAKK